MKKLLLLIFSVIMMLAMVMTFSSCDSDEVKFKFTLSDDWSYYILEDVKNANGHVTIPEEHLFLPVKRIEDNAFSGCSNLISVIATPWTAAYQAPPSMNFPGKSTGVGCHCLLRYKS